MGALIGILGPGLGSALRGADPRACGARAAHGSAVGEPTRREAGSGRHARRADPASGPPRGVRGGP
eukprot:707983-Prymnesium_polylepis.1